MSSEKIHDFSSVKHKTLAEMAQEAVGGKANTVEKKIAVDAAQQGHDGFMPVPVAVQGTNGKQEIRGAGTPATPSKGQRGRIVVFIPTKEKVTVTKERVGQNYNGGWIHEVTSREGKNFLAADSQLKELV